MTTNYESIDQYISSFPASTQKLLEEFRATAHETAPDATEKISYQMPHFYLNGGLVAFAGYKNHIGFYPGASTIQTFGDELKRYKTSIGTVQFPIDQPLPIDLIKRIVSFRVDENLQKPQKRKR